jgi:hypothetical protein
MTKEEPGFSTPTPHAGQREAQLTGLFVLQLSCPTHSQVVLSSEWTLPLPRSISKVGDRIHRTDSDLMSLTHHR